jgi:hypothetical protein
MFRWCFKCRKIMLHNLQGCRLCKGKTCPLKVSPTSRLRGFARLYATSYADKRTKGVVYAELLKRKHKRNKR